jgi:hypothetical protein
MKQLLIILMVCFVGVAYGQNKCDSGYSYVPTIMSSGTSMIADTCLPDSLAKKMWQSFFKGNCGETDMWSMNEDYMGGTTSTWVNDSIGCVTTEKYKMKVKNKWVEISKCLYYWGNKSKCSTYDGKEFKDVPCCGHIHKTKPLQ